MGAHARRATETILIILGVHDGHNASAALVVDGAVVAAVEEERFSRRKNQAGWPDEAIASVLGLAGVSLHDVDVVAVAGLWSAPGTVDRDAHTREATLARHQAILEDRGRGRARDWFARRASVRIPRRRVQLQARRAAVAAATGGRPVELIDHHTCHAAAAYHAWSPGSGSVLVLTADGDGDDLSATVSVAEGGQLRRLAVARRADSLGWPYEAVTYLLGMQPMEHEFKVMGLAPYGARSPEAVRLASSFRALWELPEGDLVWRRSPGVGPLNRPTRQVADLIGRARFDHVAAAAQAATEQLLCEWVERCVAVTGIRRVAVSGGVFMNVKANGAILSQPSVDELFVMPTCSDASNSIGAAYAAAARRGVATSALGPLYLGDAITDEDARAALAALPAVTRDQLDVTWPDDPEEAVAGLLAAGEVVGRATGRMEFGARALGNRSLLADPSDRAVVAVLNDLVKARDFWMPFAPAAPAEDAERWVQKPSKPTPPRSPYMMFAFPARPDSADAFPAAQHPADRTARLQEVDRAWNPSFHRLLRSFEARTGRSILLNTSLNIHGSPIARTATEALEVLGVSGLRHLQLAGALVTKRT